MDLGDAASFEVAAGIFLFGGRGASVFACPAWVEGPTLAFAFFGASFYP